MGESYLKIKSQGEWKWLHTVILCAGPVAGAILYNALAGKAATDIFSNVIFSILLIGVFHTFLCINDRYFCRKIKHPMLYAGVFALSFLMLGATARLPFGVLWMLMVVVAALDGGLEIAVPTHIVCMIQYAFMILPNEYGFYRFSGYLLFGIIAAVLLSMFCKTEATGYLCIILLACDGIVQCIAYRFNLARMKKYGANIGIELFSVLFLVLAGWIYLKKSILSETEESEEAEVLDSVSEETAEKEAEEKVENKIEIKAENTDEVSLLESLTASDFELLERLRNYSESLLEHSSKVSALSEKAAQAVGGDVALAKAGGMYHEIGRIEDETDYIEAGTRIGKAYDFPKELLDVMRQHSTGFEFPKSVEAAVVMLSDCIISTSEYLEKTGKRSLVSDEHLVKSIFQNRIEKGNLQYADMTQEQIQALCDFYVGNTFAREG